MNGFDEAHKTKNIEMYSEAIQREKKEVDEKHFR